ncbi:MAG: hypothetical protein KGN84_05605 [Acidobacteriota bacterium]|nr:hypothetical protein [Acidobacteriota bacterium]
MLIKLRQNFPHRRLADVSGAVRAELEASGLAGRLAPGSRVAIGAGSRGISNLAAIARASVDYFASHGHRPFLFPAMGSHGAGNAAGQASVLAHYGIDEAAMGCPVVSTFDVVPLGRSDAGIEVFAGRDAWESDGVFPINRIKWHTSFAGGIESGVTKMMAIGLGKLESAKTVHGHGRKMGMDAAIRSVARHLIGTGKILGGLGVLEDAYHDTAMVAALPAESLVEREEELLKTAKSWMARIPVPAVDLVIVDEIGKNISGTGMDLKIVNRGTAGQVNPWPEAPKVERIFVRDLSGLSYGNAVGIGAADVLHERVIPKIDVNAGRVNALASGSLGLVKTPLSFGSDRECIDVLMASVGKFDRKDVTAAWIRNTLDLGVIAITENLTSSVSGENTEFIGTPFDFEFDGNGNLGRFA